MIILENIGPLILLLIVFLFFITKVKIAKEQERFAIVTFGRFVGFKGPGLIIKRFGGHSKWERISCGDRGEIVRSGLTKVNGAEVPFLADNDISPGDFVRISDFDGNKVSVVKDRDQRRVFVCEECGHENQIS